MGPVGHGTGHASRRPMAGDYAPCAWHRRQACLQPPMSSRPAPTAQLLQQGLFHHRQGDLSSPWSATREVLRNDPENAEALYYVAVVACQEDQFKQGVELARRALAKAPPQARVHNLLGQALDRLGEPLEAIKGFDQAIALDAEFRRRPRQPRQYPGRWPALPDEALKSFDRALALDPNSAPDWINRGALLQDLGRHAEALESYDKALALAPDDASILMNRANALAMLDRFARADAVYDDVIKRNPKMAWPTRTRGWR